MGGKNTLGAVLAHVEAVLAGEDLPVQGLDLISRDVGAVLGKVLGEAP
jgi:hypothetical protein